MEHGPAAPRTLLEPLRLDHAEGMFAGLCDGAAYTFLPGEPPRDLAAVQARFRRLVAGRSADGTALWFNWVVRRGSDGAFLGYTQATVAGGLATVAYHVSPPFWRQGIGRGALAATLDLVFGPDSVSRAQALVDTRNQASQGLLGSLGFRAISTMRQADFFKGSASDETRFALTRSEWLASGSSARTGGVVA